MWGKLAAQLPPIAQSLYNEAYKHDTIRGQYCINNGAVAMATDDGNSFYLQWFPIGETPATHPLLVTIHGTAGNAFDEFYLWHQYAAAKGVGIIAMQWYRGDASVSPNDYFDDTTLYNYIDTALTRIQYPFNKAFFHGFSRGSAISYAIAFRDVQKSGKNYFCTIMSNSGKPDSSYYLYAQINSGNFGHTFYNGKHWGVFCGGLDSGLQTCCQAMYDSKLWVEANNGIVDLFIQDPNLGHGGFQQTPAYIDSALNYYLPCYFDTTSAIDNVPNTSFKIFPNPVENNLFLNIETNDLKDIYIYDLVGLQKKYFKCYGNELNIDVSTFPHGIYIIKINNEVIKFIKK